MLTPTTSVLNRINTQIRKRKLNILTCPTHEAYESYLCQTGHNFYALQGVDQYAPQGIKRWETKYRTTPSNYHIFTQFNERLYDVPFDLILSQERFSQLPRALNFRTRWQIPVIHVDHTEPPKDIAPDMVAELIAQRADQHVYITEHNKQAWKGTERGVVIRHGLDTNKFSGWTGGGSAGVSVVNLHRERDVFTGYKIWEKVASEVPVKLIGDNPSFGIKPINDVDVLIGELRSSQFFLNTSTWSPVPMALIEAAAVGCPIVSTAYQEVPKIFEHEKSALLSNDPAELIQYCNRIAQDPVLAKRLGDAARETVIKHFGQERFLNEWNELFYKTYEEAR